MFSFLGAKLLAVTSENGTLEQAVVRLGASEGSLQAVQGASRTWWQPWRVGGNQS